MNGSERQNIRESLNRGTVHESDASWIFPLLDTCDQLEFDIAARDREIASMKELLRECPHCGTSPLLEKPIKAVLSPAESTEGAL